MLKIENLMVAFKTQGKAVNAVNDVSLTVKEREFLGIVGPSGCGKTTLGLAVMGLIESPGEILSGKIYIDEIEVLSSGVISSVRGRKISMIFQDPYTSLNPVLRIGDQISECLMIYSKMSHKESRGNAISVLEQLKINEPENVFKQYPHELSGGMRQRVMIAIALVSGAKYIIADEPTTALDVINQKEIMEILKELNMNGVSVILISHDMRLVKRYCSRTIIMDKGAIKVNG